MLKKLFTVAFALALLAPNAIGQEKPKRDADVEVRKALAELETVSASLRSMLIELEKVDESAESIAKAKAVKNSIAELESEIAQIRKMGDIATKLRSIEATEVELLESDEILEEIEIEVIEEEERPRGFLGVNLADHEGPGVRITSTIAGSPARKAKFREGDVILAIGKNEVENVEGLAGLISKHKPGSIVHLRMQRGDERFNFKLKLGNRDEILAVAEREAAEGRGEIIELAESKEGKGGRLGPREMKNLEKLERQMVELRQVLEQSMKKFHDMGARLEQHVEQAHAMLKKRRYGQAAEHSMAAAQMAEQREQAERHIGALREKMHQTEIHMEQARAEARKREGAGERERDRERAEKERREREPERAKKPRGGIEDRVANLEKRLERIEHLLEKIANR